MNDRKCRVAIYSPGVVEVGRIRRNASIDQALRRSALQPFILRIAEARRAGALPTPKKADAVTLPALRNECNGRVRPRFLDVSKRDLIALRAKVISRVIKVFKTDLLIVDHLPLADAGQLSRTLEPSRKAGNPRGVPGLHDVLRDPGTMQRIWSDQANADAIRDYSHYYDAIWIYGGPPVYDTVCEYGLFDQGDLPPDHRADHVIVLGRHNTVCEVLSIQNHPLPLAPNLNGAGDALLNSYPFAALGPIGGELFDAPGVRPVRPDKEMLGSSFTLLPRLVYFERRFGAGFGFELFSVDIVETGGRSYVLDISGVASFKGAPTAPRRLAEDPYAAVRRVVGGARLLRLMPNSARPSNGDPPAQRSAMARWAGKTALPRHATGAASPAWESAAELPVQMPGAPAPAVAPPPGRHVRARCVAFRGPHAGDEKRFLLQEWTTKFDDGTSSRDYIWVRGQYVLVVPVSDGRVVFIRQYKKAAEKTLLVLPWGEIERDESPLDAGRRELEEETGYTFGAAEVYGSFHDLPDKSTGGHWVVVARNAYRKADPAPDEGERIFGVELIPVGELWQHHIPVLMHVGALRLAGL